MSITPHAHIAELLSVLTRTRYHRFPLRLEPTRNLWYRAPKRKDHEFPSLLAESTVHVLVNKSSNADVVEKATKILAAIDNHVNDGCSHCTEMLKEIYKIEK